MQNPVKLYGTIMNCLTFSNFSFTILYNIFRIFASKFYVFFLIQNNSNNFNYCELSENWRWSADGKKMAHNVYTKKNTEYSELSECSDNSDFCRWYILYTQLNVLNYMNFLIIFLSVFEMAENVKYCIH